MKKLELVAIAVGIAVVALVVFLSKGSTDDIVIKDDCESITGGSFIVNFDTDGGNEIESKSVCIACAPSSYEKLPVPEKEGYTFDGWYYDKEYTKAVEGETMLGVTANPKLEGDECIVGYNDVTIYAKYIKE